MFSAGRHTILLLLAITGLVACAKHIASNSLHPRASCKPLIVGGGSRGSGLSTLSPTTQAVYALTTTDTSVRGYIIAARGRPYWFAGSIYGSGGTRDVAAGKREETWRAGPYRFTVVYDSVANTAELAGTRIALDTGNVVLLDRVDSVGGAPRVVGALCAPEIRMNGPVRPLLDLLPALRAYAGSEAGT